MPRTRISSFPAVSVGCLLMTGLWTGCFSGEKRVRLSGSVTYQGQPVVKGQIRFDPKPGTAAAVVVEEILDGRYATSTTGGVSPGKYRVEIRAVDPSAPPPKEPFDPPPPQILPNQYNINSQLEIGVESTDTARVFDFHLK